MTEFTGKKSGVRIQKWSFPSLKAVLRTDYKIPRVGGAYPADFC